MTPHSCAECGARIEVNQEQCDLCGWSFADAEFTYDVLGSAKLTFGPQCNQCDGHHPPGARYCSQCGVALQEVTQPAARPRQARTKRKAAVVPGTGRQVGLIFGLAALLVAALFMITAVSKTTHRPETASLVPADTVLPVELAPLSAGLSARIEALDLAINQDSTAATAALEREKVFVLAQGGRTDLAAEAQQDIARRTGDLEDWRMAGNLYYDWMMDVEDPTERAYAANLAVTAYEAVLVGDPENHDVRTDMATAYLNTGNPMLGVTAIKRVLEAAPDHLNANFNYGLMLARINRTDEALEQLIRVLELAPDTASTHNRRARALMASIRGQAGT